MELQVKQGSITDEPCDAIIVNLFEGVKSPGGGTGAVDRALGGAISELIQEQEFEGRLGDVLTLRSCGAIPAKNVLVVGLGKSEDMGTREIMRAAGAAARKCQDLRAKTVASIVHGAGIGGRPAYDCAKATALGTILGTYQHTRLKTGNAKENPIQTFCLVEVSAEKLDQLGQGVRRARVMGDSICLARDLANEPSNVVTPSYLAEVAQEIASEAGMECSVWDRRMIEEAGMGLLAAVARGAEVEPRFIQIKYTSPGAAKTIALVGKGITFDTGGYSLKTGDSMYGMKDDMAGAANVLAAMKAVGVLRPKVNVLALIPATENAIGQNAIHPGDVFRSYAGKMVEVNNTDAEGRLILADAVAYAVKQGVDEVIDEATLTGGCVVALGRDLAGVFGSDQATVDRVIQAAKACGDQLWQLPLHAEYREDLKSDIADLKNVAGREASAINGALFIESFVENTTWTHIDLSSAMIDKDTHLARKGATAVGAGTLIEYVMGLDASA